MAIAFSAEKFTNAQMAVEPHVALKPADFRPEVTAGVPSVAPLGTLNCHCSASIFPVDPESLTDSISEFPAATDVALAVSETAAPES